MGWWPRRYSCQVVGLRSTLPPCEILWLDKATATCLREGQISSVCDVFCDGYTISVHDSTFHYQPSPFVAIHDVTSCGCTAWLLTCLYSADHDWQISCLPEVQHVYSRRLGRRSTSLIWTTWPDQRSYVNVGRCQRVIMYGVHAARLEIGASTAVRLATRRWAQWTVVSRVGLYYRITTVFL